MQQLDARVLENAVDELVVGEAVMLSSPTAAIVVAEDCEYSRWRSQFAQELRTRARVLREPVGAATMVFHHRNSDEIAGEYNQIRTKFVHQVHAFADWHDREVIFVMEVAQLSNSESIELMRQMPQANLNPHNFRAVRLN